MNFTFAGVATLVLLDTVAVSRDLDGTSRLKLCCATRFTKQVANFR